MNHAYVLLIVLISLGAIAVPNALVTIWVWRKMRDQATHLPKQFWFGWALLWFGAVALASTICGGAMVWALIRPR